MPDRPRSLKLSTLMETNGSGFITPSRVTRILPFFSAMNTRPSGAMAMETGSRFSAISCRANPAGSWAVAVWMESISNKSVEIYRMLKIKDYSGKCVELPLRIMWGMEINVNVSVVHGWFFLFPANVSAGTLRGIKH